MRNLSILLSIIAILNLMAITSVAFGYIPIEYLFFGGPYALLHLIFNQVFKNKINVKN